MTAGAAPADLDTRAIERALEARGTRLGRPFVSTAETVSTNDDAKAAARAGAPAGAAFVADTQRAGRGRLGRTWHSPPGENLYASWILRPTLAPHLVPPMTLAAGLAVADALAPYVRAGDLGIKWPNDVWVKGRKIAGVLLEAELKGNQVDSVIVGIGVNVRTTTFPPDLADRATSLALSVDPGRSGAAAALDRGALFVALSAALERRIARFEQDGAAALAEDIAALDVLAGRLVDVEGETFTAIRIDEDGALRVRTARGEERRFGAGEVTLHDALRA